MKKLRRVLVIAMIPSRSKALNNQTQALLFHQCINHIHSHQNHTLVRNKPKTKTRRRIQQPQKITPRPRNPIPFVTNLKQIHDPEEALSLFHEYHQMGSKHDYPSYASLIYKLARARDFEAVETVLGYIQDYNIRCKEILFIALIQHYGKAHLCGKIDGACFFLEEMEKRKMRLDLNAWEALVRDACVGDESVDGLLSELDFSAWQLIRDMRFQFSSIHDRYIVSVALPGCESMVVIDLLGNRKMRAGLRYSETPDG
ncbi:hypothetical protein Pint_32308 [Pistacia integerrima]|uniref:Uncharacterized protein n=1 Tax=Pistacia integerrima TaxID=434235 RepID=A0ACC0XQX7_9ROSI|nr:hypothetical protein Pint_32308 [Pistacia integerrima]